MNRIFKATIAAYVGVWAVVEPLSYLGVFPAVTVQVRVAYLLSFLLVAVLLWRSSGRTESKGDRSEKLQALFAKGTRDREKGTGIIVTTMRNPMTPGEPAIDVAEGEFTTGWSTWGATVTLPPFAAPPDVAIIPRDGNKAPRICSVTTDSFSVAINDSSLAGTWRWRAKGQLLRAVAKEDA